MDQNRRRRGGQRIGDANSRTQELRRGRLTDHIQLVVADVEASRRFYRAVFEVLGFPSGGEAPDFFWANELFVSSKENAATRPRHSRSLLTSARH
jgi:hypothetical protein